VIGRTSSQSLPIIETDESLGQMLLIKKLTQSHQEVARTNHLIKDVISPKGTPARLVISPLRCHDITPFIWDGLSCILLCHPCQANPITHHILRARAISKAFSAPWRRCCLTAWQRESAARRTKGKTGKTIQMPTLPGHPDHLEGISGSSGRQGEVAPVQTLLWSQVHQQKDVGSGPQTGDAI